MNSNKIPPSTWAESLNKIRQRVSGRVKNAKLDTRDEEIAYLLGIVDALTNDIDRWVI